MGRQHPSSMAEMRGIKAEGGWGVITTEECEIHHSSELTGMIESRLWDDSDVPVLAKMCDKVLVQGALAGIELTHSGMHAANNYSREIPIGPSARPVDLMDPVQARAMGKADIRALRRMHRSAALRARKAGFDIVYVYAGHEMTTLMHFLSRALNDRTDEYGGSLENRVRLLREVLEDTKEAVGDSCAVALRLAVDEMKGADGIVVDAEGREIVEMLAELPDLWDVNISGWKNDSATSRFAAEGFQADYISFVKSLTSKPVVGVGRFTSPDTMVSLVRKGVLDLIGAARPSIADPFLPRKIAEGRVEDICECIGCNICVSGDFLIHPIRCTQNPTMAEASGAVGGRVAIESRLPGLTAWKRVADYRAYQIGQMSNVHLYLESRLTADEVLEFAADHVAIAIGARWAAHGIGRQNRTAIPTSDNARVMTPDDICAGRAPEGPVVIFDDDHYYTGGLMAEKLRADGHDVTYVTSAPDVSPWTHNTMEQGRIQTRLMQMGVSMVPLHNLARIGADHVALDCVHAGRRREKPCGTCIPVTMRTSVDDLYDAVAKAMTDEAAPKTLTRIGDCLAPGTITAGSIPAIATRASWASRRPMAFRFGGSFPRCQRCEG